LGRKGKGGVLKESLLTRFNPKQVQNFLMKTKIKEDNVGKEIKIKWDF
jgi:hypothetical protein